MVKYWLAKITADDYFEYAIENNTWLMQQQYNEQVNSAVTNIWSNIKDIKEGDFLMLGYSNKIHAIGEVCKPKNIPQVHNVSTIKETLDTNSHKFQHGFTIYGDNEIFYENLSEFDGEWGQRIDVKKWEYYCADGISNSGIQEGSTNNLAVLSIFEITPTYYDKKLLQLKKKFMESLSFEQKVLNLLKHNKNIILNGAPGTGKTYLAKKIAQQLILPSNKKEEIATKSVEPYLLEKINSDELNNTNNSWKYWKSRILSSDFCLDDFANTRKHVKDPNRYNNGYYLMNFLERASSIFGSSKPGNAYRYGIKMNADNDTYTIYLSTGQKFYFSKNA